MKCPECNSEIQAEDKFCRECGAKISPICPNCGSEVSHKDKFCPECGTKLDEATKTEKLLPTPKLEDMRERLYIPESIRQRRDAAELEIQGENRLVTALFADISGFSHLSNQHSSEKVVNIVNDCFKIIVDTVFRYEGDPNRFIGDNVLAFFGAPITHENDPERAIMAALEMRDKVKELSLNISIGMNTGMMYFGPIGTREHLEVSAYGPDINLAKRLQETANPDQILIGSGTYKFTKRIFDFSLMPNLSVKGFDDPVTAYEVSKVKAHPEKLRGIDGLYAGMVGRDREYAELMDSVSQWLSGNGQMVSIIGEAGIGKSRLVKELKSYLTTKHTPNPSNTPLHPSQEGNHNPLNPPLLRGNSNSPFEKGGWGDLLYLEGRCVSIGQPISYWPFIDILRTLFDFKEDDSERDIAQKVREGITKLFPNKADDILPFIGHLMSIRFGDDLDRKLDGYSSEQIRHQTMVRLRDIFTALARQNPLLLIIEDLHWSDDLSLDLISLLMDELMTTQMMIVCVYRPEQEHRCMKLSSLAQRKCFENFTGIQLQKLSKVQSSQLVQSLLTIDALPEKVREIILLKSEGNPFFIEEVIRSLIDKGLVYKDGDKWTTRVDISDISVPDTIHGVIMERIDRLESETKYVLQCASVIGRLFKYRLLDHLMSHERRLEQYLDELESKDLVYEERSIPELEYTFKHALTQEATYQTILEQRQKAFHRQVAEGIESLYSDRLEEFYEELAHHWEQSGNKEKTLDYLIKAGQKASRNYLNETAINYYTQAINLAKEMGISGDKLAEMYYIRGEVYIYTNFYEECITDMLESVKQYNQRSKRAKAYSQIARTCAWYIGDQEEAVKYARKALDEINLEDGSPDTAYTCLNIATVLSFSGAIVPEEAEKFLKRAIEVSEQLDDKESLADYYAVLDWLYAYIFKLDMQDELYRETHEKAIFYLRNVKLSLSRYSDDCVNVSWFMDDINEWLNLKWEAFNAGVKSGNIWSTVISASQLGEYYHNHKEYERAIEVYEPAWSMGIKTRWIFWGFLTNIADGLIEIYVSKGEKSKLLNMMQQVVDSTFMLHSKVNVHPSIQGRWNETVEQIYKKLHEVAINVYHEFEETLKSCINNAENDGERFFYYGQLMILTMIDSRSDDVEIYCKELQRLRINAGTFAERINSMTKWTIELLNTSPDQRLILIENLFKPFDIEHFNDLLKTIETTHQMLTEDEMIHLSDTLSDRIIILLEETNIDYLFIDYLFHPLELIYTKINNKMGFYRICQRIKTENPEKLESVGMVQLYPEPAKLPDSDEKLEFIDKFASLSSDWELTDPKGDCSYEFRENGLLINVSENHEFWSDGVYGNFNAPRLLREISGDFILETKIADGINGKKSGGLLVWKGEKSFLRFEMPSSSMWEGEVRFEAHIKDNYRIIGRGLLDADQLILRLIRQGDHFSAYCSKDGVEWLTCGYVDFLMNDPIKIGIIAHCPKDVAPSTSTRFEYFKIYCG